MSKKFLQTSSVLTLIGLSFFSFSAKSMDRLQQDAEFNQALGRGNPIPLNYPQPARGGGQVHHIVPNPIHNDDYDDGFWTDWSAIYPRNSQQKKEDQEIYDFGKRNKLYKNEDGSDLRSSDDDS